MKKNTAIPASSTTPTVPTSTPRDGQAKKWAMRTLKATVIATLVGTLWLLSWGTSQADIRPSLSGLTNGTRYDVQVRGVNTTGNGPWSASTAATPVSNTSPVFTEGATTTRSTAENTAESVHIGTTVEATDADGDDLTYVLGGSDADSFNIDDLTGQISVGKCPSLDYETRDRYAVTVFAIDPSGASANIMVTISIEDIGLDSVIGDRYDINKDEVIDKKEALAAIDDYFDFLISKPEAIEVLLLYLFS